MKKAIFIDKENVKDLRFPNKEVLTDKKDIIKRRLMLERATALGNIDKQKFRILFEDDEGLKYVETTIWATTEKRICLKGGVCIPINRIHYIDF